MAQYSLQFGKLGWRGRIGLVVAVALGLAAAIALVILSLGLALILIPVVAVAMVIGRWRLGKMMADAEAERTRRGAERTIEIEYEVVGKDRDGR